VVIRPYIVDVPQQRLDWIARRVADAHIGYAPDDDGVDWQYGTSARYLAEFRAYWRDNYDWQAAQARFNSLPQFLVEIEGIDLHFYHLCASGDRKGYPIILTHGWPGSVFEFLDVIPLLAARGFDVIVPSLPGYGFSGRPCRPIGASDVARLWRALMVDHLGYTRFGAQGGDWGASITTALAEHHADVVDAFHLNFLFMRAKGALSPEVVEWQNTARKRFAGNGAYSMQMQTRPQTIGLALADSPIGYASWVLEKYRAWSDCGGNIEASFTKEQLITSIMTYLVSDNVQASMWLYNSLNSAKPGADRITVPMGFAAFPGETPPPPRSLAETRYNIVHWTVMPRGGHFAAWEEPELFVEDVTAFFAGHR
jgi:pimeloyl-ACP methyl ester carboxylesterase